MKKADSLTEKITSKVSETSGIKKPVAAVEAMAARKGKANGHRDHIDVINQVFTELELAYHNQYHKAYAQEGSIGLAKKYWLECLSNFSPELILQATRNVVTSQEYLPSIASIIRACEDALVGAGLPAAHDAYIEACCASHPKVEHQWTHPAVYLAGRETGWFEIGNKTEKQIFPLFGKQYRALCQRVLHGEELVIEKQEALPDPYSKTLSLEENKARMAELRKNL